MLLFGLTAYPVCHAAIIALFVSIEFTQLIAEWLR
jgi:hypothetical protein